jgi:L-alanine-DL-glutamate epimerase-like enolase superfamily enzyme
VSVTSEQPAISDVHAEVYRFPTDTRNSDGTLSWDATTAVVVQVAAGGLTGLGWTYSTSGAAALVQRELRDAIVGRNAFDVPSAWESMVRGCRNLGRPGVTSAAIAAVDIALWDLKARLLDLPLHALFGRARETVPVYGSGGFTSQSEAELRKQLDGWQRAGCTAVKIKVAQSWGTNVARDLQRTALVTSVMAEGAEIMVDANGGYTVGQAARVGAQYDELGVVWFEEPVSSDDLVSLASLRGQLRCDIAAGEYADSVSYVRRMLQAEAVDCLQVDVTRCGGYTEWLRCAAVAGSHQLQISAHCAPALHACVAAAVPNLRHVEWFADHAKLEPLLVDGVPEVRDGAMHLTQAPGHGMTLRADASTFLIN